MADEKKAKNPPAAAAPEGEDKGSKQVKSGKREEAAPSRWTLPTCMKIARRFDSEDAWAKGAPSCYKAATSRGFAIECMKHMKGRAAAGKKKSA
jgi:hypothetical protein